MIPTCEQVDNARLLAAGLEKIVAEEYNEYFNMAYWVNIIDDASRIFTLSESVLQHRYGEHPKDCGTTGCALGWAPYLLGIPITKVESNGDWVDYAKNVFGVSNEWFIYLFYNSYVAQIGRKAAIDAANRLREYIEYFEEDCLDD